MKPIFQNKPLGFRLGFALVFIGVIFAIANHLLLTYSNSTFNILIGFPIFIFWGFGLIFFTGAKSEAFQTTLDLKNFFKNSPLLHKIIWIFTFLLGMVGTFFIFKYYHLK